MSNVQLSRNVWYTLPATKLDRKDRINKEPSPCGWGQRNGICLLLRSTFNAVSCGCCVQPASRTRCEPCRNHNRLWHEAMRMTTWTTPSIPSGILFSRCYNTNYYSALHSRCICVCQAMDDRKELDAFFHFFATFNLSRPVAAPSDLSDGAALSDILAIVCVSMPLYFPTTHGWWPVTQGTSRRHGLLPSPPKIGS